MVQIHMHISFIDVGFIVIAYLFGSIPSGLLLTKMAGLGDIRQMGSGNIGTTNVLRTGNKVLAALTLFFDMMKGMMAVSFAVLADSNLIIMGAALAAIIGHMYPVWLSFRGGKGVATTFGVMLALYPSLGILMLLIWVGMGFAFKISSLAALVSIGLAPALAFLLFGQMNLAWLSAFIALLVFWRHRENIERLLSGTESRISLRKKS